MYIYTNIYMYIYLYLHIQNMYIYMVIQYIQYLYEYIMGIAHPSELKYIMISVYSDAATFVCNLITDTNTQRHRDTEIE